MPSKTQPSETLHFLYTCLQNSDYKTIDFSAVGAATRLNPPAARMRYTRLKRQIESGMLRGGPFQRPGTRKRDGGGGGEGGEGEADDDDDDDEEGVLEGGEGGEGGKTGKKGRKIVSNESESDTAHEREPSSSSSSSSPAPPLAKRPTKLQQQRQVPSRGPAVTPRPSYIPVPPPISADSPAHPADDDDGVPSSGSSESHGS